jgi:hypothetical protein
MIIHAELGMTVKKVEAATFKLLEAYDCNRQHMIMRAQKFKIRCAHMSDTKAVCGKMKGCTNTQRCVVNQKFT